MEKTPTITLEVTYKNIPLATKIKKWSYTDNLSGSADDVDITLEDTQHLWMGSWTPRKGSTIKASIVNRDNRKMVYSKGLFEIDELEVEGPPSEATIRGISVPDSSPMREEGRQRAWEKVTLKKVAGDIAHRNRLKLVYDVDEPIKYDRVEQAGKSDVAFLMELCEDDGLAFKISNKQIIIFDESVYEVKPSKQTIKRSDSRILRYRGKTSNHGTYKSCKVTYRKKDMKKTYSDTFTDPHAPSGVKRVLIVQEDVKDEAAALRRAKARLRNANKDAITMYLIMRGYVNYYAGMTVDLSEFGTFNGKYIITSITSSGGKSTTTSLELRKCLRGY
ncbi:phage late control D family protein [Niallia sp. 01092]|uniref:phage late control D family protein n=1 Tax=unclassified Niallia TaxID=2837522 RepID=UPI003FCF3B76